MKRNLLLLIAFPLLVFISCKSTAVETNSTYKKSKKDEVNFVICGDVMAHTQNFRTPDFNMIWDGVRDITENSDFTIANIEAPVCADQPFENYPTFNMQPSYPQAAIDAGINLITIANNHTNDQSAQGIIKTSEWAKETVLKYSGTSRPVYISGLKEDVSTDAASKESSPTFCYFTKDKIRILFLGVTQILNSQDSASRINYFPHTKKGKQNLKDLIIKLKAENPCDVFILAMHSDEPEYNLTVFKERRKWYFELLDAGVDILWANHPHCPKPIEYVGDSKTQKITKAILYSTGNTISGQRHRPNYENPESMHEYTGEGFLVNLTVKKQKDSIYITNTHVNYITTYIDDSRNYVIRKLDENFYKELEETNHTAWKGYLIKRENLLRELKETTTWQ
ncbi:MAG: CapA family protein [Treponema sp.]|nr:CapA family protein [Candidatus Treponema scatequi]